VIEGHCIDDPKPNAFIGELRPEKLQTPTHAGIVRKWQDLVTYAM
jgi:hypothetical protein